MLREEWKGRVLGSEVQTRYHFMSPGNGEESGWTTTRSMNGGGREEKFLVSWSSQVVDHGEMLSRSGSESRPNAGVLRRQQGQGKNLFLSRSFVAI